MPGRKGAASTSGPSASNIADAFGTAARSSHSRGTTQWPMAGGHFRGFRPRIEHRDKSIAKRVGRFGSQSAFHPDFASSWIPLHCTGGKKRRQPACHGHIRPTRFAAGSFIGVERRARFAGRFEKTSADTLFLDSINVSNLLHGFVDAIFPGGRNCRAVGLSGFSDINCANHYGGHRNSGSALSACGGELQLPWTKREIQKTFSIFASAG